MSWFIQELLDNKKGWLLSKLDQNNLKEYEEKGYRLVFEKFLWKWLQFYINIQVINVIHIIYND